MKCALLLHGKPPFERYGDSGLLKPHEANWFPWVSERLRTDDGIEVTIPALTWPYFPIHALWKADIASYRLDKDTGVAAFSASTDFILRLMSEDPSIKLERLALLGPYRDREGKYGGFSEYTLDSGIVDRIGRLSVIYSLDDNQAIRDNAAYLLEALPGAHKVELDGFGHFMIGNKMTGPEFPELITELHQPLGKAA